MDDVTNKAGAGARPQRLEIILRQLTELAERQKATAERTGKPLETVADDADIGADRQKLIGLQEAIVRPVLALFGIDYGSLIAMDGKSLYSQAVQARPDMLKAMLASDMPVLEALKVAVAYKPYAEFGQKYGRTPDEVKAKIRAEALAEAGVAAPAAADAEPPQLGAVFAGVGGQRAVAPRRRQGSLSDVFGR